jgi:hypothetical protein
MQGFVATLLLAGSTASAQTASRDKDAVLEAVFREQISNFLKVEDRDAIVCLEVIDGLKAQDPSDALLRRFVDNPNVRKASACTAHPKGAFETLTRKPAVVLTAGPIQWLSGTEAEVQARFFRSAVGHTRPTYRVLKDKDRDRWVSWGPSWKHDVL